MHRIEPVIRDYAWGSHTSLARLGGRAAPTSRPEAELWVGAHEGSPCLIPTLQEPLDACIAKDREFALGAWADRFGGRLPFLLKILAAEKALSIQAHPDAARASSAPGYVDAWAKPEAWIPLEDCEAFIGSLSFDDAAETLLALSVNALTDVVERARTAHQRAHALLSGLLRLPEGEHAGIVEHTVAALHARLPEVRDPETRAAWECILRVHDQFPGDIGVVVLLTMKHHVLRPGTSTYLAAGVLHTFVRGTTIEILANSDNVVRAGLTDKDIDVEELLTIVDVEAQVAACSPRVDGPVSVYETPAEHFTLSQVEVAAGGSDVALPGEHAPTLVLALGGAVSLRAGEKTVELDRLGAAWIPAGDPQTFARSDAGASLFIATPGRWHGEPTGDQV